MKAKYFLLTALAALAMAFAAPSAQAQGAYYYSKGYHHQRSFHHHHRHYGNYHHHRGWHRSGQTTVIVTP